MSDIESLDMHALAALRAALVQKGMLSSLFVFTLFLAFSVFVHVWTMNIDVTELMNHLLLRFKICKHR